MKKVILAMVAIASLCGVSRASISGTWSYGGGDEGDLNQGTPGRFSPNWLVQLYKDSNNDSIDLGEITGFTAAGSVLGSANVANDQLVASVSTSLFDAGGGFVYWAGGQSWDAVNNMSVYTVIFNATSLAAGPTAAIVLDSATHPIPFQSSEESAVNLTHNYAVTEIAHDWVPVPEPGSLALMGIGAMIIGIRKAIRK